MTETKPTGQMKTTTTYRAQKSRPVMDLYLCTVYKDTVTPEMKFNYEKLNQVENLNVHYLGIEAGYFSHRHQKGIPDPVQIQWRDEYLKNVPVSKWMLVLDSDETIGGAVDRIPDVLYLMEHFDQDYGSISEIKSDLELKLRPRFIYKRYEHLTYGGPEKRHDVIWCSPKHDDPDCEDGCEYCDHIDGKCYPDGHDHELSECPKGYNYIDVSDDARDRSWILDFLYFNHYKSGYGMSIFSLTEKLPSNLATLEHVDMQLETMEVEQ